MEMGGVFLVEPAYDEKDQVSDLWIVPSDGSAKPRRLTFSKGGESGVAWSADSRQIAFSARVKATKQVRFIYWTSQMAAKPCASLPFQPSALTAVAPGRQSTRICQHRLSRRRGRRSKQEDRSRAQSAKYRARVYEKFRFAIGTNGWKTRRPTFSFRTRNPARRRKICSPEQT